MCCKIKWILLAAGNSRRFGSNKLLFPIEGKAMYQYAVDIALAVSRETIILVTQDTQLLEGQYKNAYITIVQNVHPDRGISYSMQLGLLAAGKAEGYLFLVCDQPYLTEKTLQRLCECFIENPDAIVTVSDGKQRGNPAIFPCRFLEELFALKGDIGGKQVIKRHLDSVCSIVVEGKELNDMDRPVF